MLPEIVPILSPRQGGWRCAWAKRQASRRYPLLSVFIGVYRCLSVAEVPGKAIGVTPALAPIGQDAAEEAVVAGALVGLLEVAELVQDDIAEAKARELAEHLGWEIEGETA